MSCRHLTLQFARHLEMAVSAMCDMTAVKTGRLAAFKQHPSQFLVSLCYRWFIRDMLRSAGSLFGPKRVPANVTIGGILIYITAASDIEAWDCRLGTCPMLLTRAVAWMQPLRWMRLVQTVLARKKGWPRARGDSHIGPGDCRLLCRR
jgi:hypothetical protein